MGRTDRTESEYACPPRTHAIGDVLLFAGDAGLDDQHEVELFEAWLAAQPFRHKVVVMGNMDRAAALPASSSSCITLKHGRVLCDEIAEVAGYRILGSPWTPAFYGQWQVSMGGTRKPRSNLFLIIAGRAEEQL